MNNDTSILMLISELQATIIGLRHREGELTEEISRLSRLIEHSQDQNLADNTSS